MSYIEVKNKIEELTTEWEQFKSINERKLKEETKHGHADALTEAHLKRLNNSMNNCSDVLNRMEAASRRPSAGTGSGVHMSSDMLEHKNAFNNYVRRGQDADLASFEQKALSTEKDNDGGFFVTSEMATQINSTLTSSSAMRQIANVTEVSSDGLEILQDTTDAAAGWSTETGGRADTAAPKVKKHFIPVHELYAQPRATQKLMDDSKIDIEAWLAEKIADSFGTLENGAFIHGDGLTKPRGFLNYADGKNSDQIERGKGPISVDSLETLYAMLGEKYKANAKFLMNHQTFAAIRSLKSKDGQYIWKPTLDGEISNTLLGLDVVLTPEMPSAEKGHDAIALGDFQRGYQIVDRSGVTTLRDPFTQKPFIKFYTTKRVGGDVLDSSAIKILRCDK